MLKKPKGLHWQEITKRLMAFMLREERMGMAMAFSEGEDKDEGPEGIRHFDPILELQNDEGRLDEIESFVNFDLRHREQALLDEANRHQSSYNMILFGAAIKLARREEMSDELREFIVEHLLNPKKPSPSSKGRPKRDPLADERKLRAITLAKMYGLDATRSNESSSISACDLVSEAAQKLVRQGHKNFAIGYGYENLRKIWNKNQNKPEEFVGRKTNI